MSDDLELPFDASRPVRAARKLHHLWVVGGDYRSWWRQMTNAYGEGDAIKLLEWFLYERNANPVQDGRVVQSVTDFLRDMGLIKPGKSR